MGLAKSKKIERLAMIHSETKDVSRLQLIRERVAKQAAKQTAQPQPQRAEAHYPRGLAEALLALLAARGFRLTAAQRKRITSCTEPAQIEAWIARAATAKSATAVVGTGR
jgi:hypothetical protein